MLRTVLCFLAVTAGWNNLHAVEPTASSDYPNSKLLIEPNALSEKLTDFVILDVRSESEYQRGHLPGAIHINHDKWKGEFDPNNAEKWSTIIGQVGIDGGKPVVVYDDAAGKNAGRIWWILKFWGVPDVRLLNGFLKGWQQRNLPMETKPVTAKPVRFDAQKQRKLLATKQDLLQSLKGGGERLQIVDARTEGEYCGDVPLSNKRAGRIPGAKNLDWEKMVDVKGTQRFLPAQALRDLFAEAGIDPAKPTATHCQSGGRAAVMVFAIELMGGENVANYYNSFGEWSKDPDAPVEKVTPNK